MLTELYRQLTALLAEAGYPAWSAEAVPSDAPFPFVTLQVRPASTLHGLGQVTLTGWLRGPCRHADRLALADALLRLVPSGGLKLPLTDGLAVLHRGFHVFCQLDAIGESICLPLLDNHRLFDIPIDLHLLHCPF